MESTKQLIKAPSGEYLIKKNDRHLNCPFQPAIPVQNSLGGLQINRLHCTSDCPHFNITEDVIEGTTDRLITVIMTCTGIQIEHEIETIIDNQTTLIS